MSLSVPITSTDRQVSTSSMAPLAPDANQDLERCEDGAAVMITTAIPIREEFRCRRAWFFYHDVRAFVTSWIPFPLFVVWRLFMALYIFSWLIAHIVFRHDEFGPRWLIYFTDLAFLFLTIGSIAIASLTVWYLVLYYRFPQKIESYIPRLSGSCRQIYRQDNIPWFAKLCWALYSISFSLAPLVMGGYWILVYRPYSCDTPTMTTSMPFNLTNDTFSTSTSMPFNFTNDMFSTPPTAGNLVCDPNEIDIYTIHFHGVNFLLVLIDLILGRVPYQFMHFFYTEFFMFPYVIFTIIYWGAGGTNPENEERYIYEPLEYSNASAFGWAIALLISPILVYWIMFLFAWLRDVISKHISCCYSNLVRREYNVETVENGTGGAENGTGGSEPESTKL